MKECVKLYDIILLSKCMWDEQTNPTAPTTSRSRLSFDIVIHSLFKWNSLKPEWVPMDQLMLQQEKT